MSAFLIVLTCLCISGLATLARFLMTRASTTKQTPVGLSNPAQRIMNRYLEIAEDKRPVINLRGMLVALDTKVGKANADIHFVDTTYSVYRPFRWTYHNSNIETGCGGSGSHWDDGGCDFQDYRNLWTEVDAATKAYHEQTYAIHAKNIDTSEVELITERLRAEVGITRQVTKEIQ